jgi:hypothetical protein
MNHKVYEKIIKALNEGTLIEPFSTIDFQKACEGLGAGTYKAFLYKHKIGNKGNNSELFEQVGVNKFKVVRPFNYGLK